MSSAPVPAGSGVPAHQAIGDDRPAETTDGSPPTPEGISPRQRSGPAHGLWAADLLTRTGVPIAGGVTAATTRSPWLLLVATAYSVLVDPASPVSRALGHVLDQVAVALGEALSVRIRQWGHRRH
jgi:hypothetical protein